MGKGGKEGEGVGGGENVTTYLSLSKSKNDVILHPKRIYPRENEQPRRLWVWGKYVM